MTASQDIEAELLEIDNLIEDIRRILLCECDLTLKGFIYGTEDDGLATTQADVR